MAKISEIKFDIKGTQFKLNVNCNSSGVFTANVPELVCESLGIQREQNASTLSELERKIKDAIEKYKNSETTEELYIFIKYGCCGDYNSYGSIKDGTLHNDKRFKVVINFNDASCLLFDFKIVMKEVIDGVVGYYSVIKGKNTSGANREEQDPNKYYKYEKLHMVEDWIKIPYTEEAFINLSQAKEKIRMVSEMLFNFVSKDENEISLILNNQKLLN